MSRSRAVKFRVSAPHLIAGVLGICLFVEVAFVVLDVLFASGRLFHSRGIQNLFNLAREDALATWFASTQAVLAGVVVFGILAFMNRRERVRTAQPFTLGWVLVGSFFTFVGIDDAAQIHERMGGVIHRTIASDGSAIFPSYSWQIIVGPVICLVGLFLAAFLWNEMKQTKAFKWLMFGACCWVFAVSVGLFFTAPFPTLAATFSTTTQNIEHFQKVIEEFFEMVGTTCFLVAFLHKFVLVAPQFQIEFAGLKTYSGISKKRRSR